MKMMTMALTFGISLTALVSNYAHADQFRSLTMEFGADRLGYDYKHIVLATNDPFACQVFCAQDNSCKAYTFVPAGYHNLDSAGPSPHCFLKNNDASLPVEKRGLISGRKLP